MYFRICTALAVCIMERNLSSVKAIVDGAKDHPDVMTSLFRAKYEECGLLKWTEVLEIRDINTILIESGFKYSNCQNDCLPCIGDAITREKWSLDNVKFMIRKGYDVNAFIDIKFAPRLTRDDPPFLYSLEI